MRRLLVTILVLLVFLILLSQLQGLLLRSLGAVDGTFGVRPISQGCVGFIANHADAARVPLGNVEFHFGLFHSSSRYFTGSYPCPFVNNYVCIFKGAMIIHLSFELIIVQDYLM